MDNLIITLILIGIIYWIFDRKIKANRIHHQSLQLEFDLYSCIIYTPQILEKVGVTKKQLNKNLYKWPKEFKQFIEDKNSQLKLSDLVFSLTYLASDNMFVVEDGSHPHTYVVPNRTPPNNTQLWSKVLRYYPNKDKDLRDPELRLEVELRDEDFDGKTLCLISVGLREFPEKTSKDWKTKYTKLFDFPFSYPYSFGKILPGELKKFGFEVKKPISIPNKDDFGKVTYHLWDTEIEFKHKCGAEITLVK